MKDSVYGFLKAKYLVSKNSTGNWNVIVFLISISMVMIGNSHYFEQKLTKTARLQTDLKEYRSEFVDVRSRLMQLKMESTISKKMELIEVYPSSVPPVKIIVKRTEE